MAITDTNDQRTMSEMTYLKRPCIQSPEKLQASIEAVSCCPGLHPILKKFNSLIASDIPLLILGDTGVGKGYFAEYAHALSVRANAPFFSVNCPGTSEGRDNAEFFGWMKGAFPGAYYSNPGYFRSAHNGTIFLDEIGNSSIQFQQRLLKVLEDLEVFPVGSSVPYEIKCRIIVGTNENLEQLVDKGVFRKDLLYRINAAEVHIPSLKDRKMDIPILAKNIVTKAALKHAKRPLELTPEAMQVLLSQEWLGNIRELSNVLTTAVICCTTDTISSALVKEQLKPKNHKSLSLPEAKANFEREHIIATLSTTVNNAQAAKLLGISLSTLRDKIRKYGIKSPSVSVRNKGGLPPRKK